MGAWPAATGGEAQVVSGVVQDATEGGPIAGVAVSQVAAGGAALASTSTDRAGRFELPLRGPAPYELRFERMGYLLHSLPLEEADPSSESIEVRLVPEPVPLAGVDVSTDREPMRFRLGNQWVTEEGLRQVGAPHLDCKFFVLDSIVIRDPDLYRPEVLTEYWPANQFMSPEAFWGLLAAAPRGTRGWSWGGWPGVPTRVVEEARPCVPHIFLPGQHPYYRQRQYVASGRPIPDPYPERTPPEPDAPLFELVPMAEIPLVGFGGGLSGAHPQVAAAVDAGGRVAVTGSSGSLVHLVEPGGAGAELVDLGGAPASLGAVTHLAWVADTLQAADAARGRVVLLPPGGGPPVVRESGPFGPPPESLAGAPTDVYDPDLAVPTPVLGGRWLSVELAPPAPYPLRFPDEPARRALALRSPDGRMERVLAILRPGPWRIDVGEPEAAGWTRPPVEPFRDHPLWTVGPHGDHLVVVERSIEVAVWMDIYTVTRMGIEGDTVFHVERPVPLVRISDEALSEVAGELADHPGVARLLPVDEDIRAMLVEAMIYRTPFHPPITDVVAGHDGTTWLRWPDERGETVRWDVLDREGEPLRTLMVDRRLRIVGADADKVWGLLPEEGSRDGVRVVRFEIGPGR